MTKITFLKGSIWRKWDLHVHTPESVLNNQFGGDWDTFVKELFTKAIEKNIYAIGITDYFTIEGYKKLKNDYLMNETKLKELFQPEQIQKIKEILILPNIEFRLPTLVDGSRINFHVIFSDELDINDIETHFLHNLNFIYDAEPQNEDYQERLKVETLSDFGKKLKNEHDHFKGTDLFVGMKNASVSDSAILKELQNKRFKGKYLVCVPPDEDLSKIKWNSAEHSIRKVIIQKCDFLMSANENTRNWALGKIEGEEKQKKEFKSLKPCLWGCDSHEYKTLFEPAQSRYTWIKADLTFEGLRQIKYEPEERVFIGEIPPLLERVANNKTKYIQSLEITKINDSKLKEEWFDGLKIEFNPELVAIIGNKGKGKSALADILGILGDSKNHEHFSFLSNAKFKNKQDKKANNFKATLTWASQESKTELLTYIPEKTAFERIKYIPQQFLELLCNEQKDILEQELKQVIFSHVPEEDKVDKENLDKLIHFKSTSILSSINSIINEIKEKNKEIIDLETKNENDFLREIKSKLETKKEQLKEHLKTKPKVIPLPEQSTDKSKIITELKGLEEFFLKRIDEAKSKKKIANKDNTSLKNIKKEIQQFETDYKKLLKKLSNKIKNTSLQLNKILSLKVDLSLLIETIKIKETEINKYAQSLDKNELYSTENIKNLLNAEIKELTKRLDKNNQAYEEYLKQNQEWEDSIIRIKGEGKYISNKDTINYYEKLINYVEKDLKTDLQKKCDERLNLVKQILEEKQKIVKICQELNFPVDKFVSENDLGESEYKIQFFASLEPQDFIKDFLSFIDQGKRGTFCGKAEGYKALLNIFDITNFSDINSTLNFLNKITEYLNKDIRYNNEKRDPHSQVRKNKLEKFYEFIFCMEYLNPKYDLKLGNTVLSKLSPGEKGALLLIFYLLIDKDDIPLILDQPEENLDNQTVYEIVVRFIKQAKKRRQIILITHNPNLAVVCDAEQIIHANLDKKNNYKVEYELGAIENPTINKKLVKVLEGTLPAFNTRNLKYSITKRLKLEEP